MGEFNIDNVHTVPQRALDCRPGLGGLNQVYRPNRLTPCLEYAWQIYQHFYQ